MQPFIQLPLYAFEALSDYLADLDVYLAEISDVAAQANHDEGHARAREMVFGCKMARQQLQDSHEGSVKMNP